jgi:AcrR family transcriptional regulator
MTVVDPASPIAGRADRAERIVQAMRDSVAEVGIAGSTFERVAARAGVSRGLLHYYFGTKERLLVEVIRRDTQARIAAIGDGLAAARTVDEAIASFFAVFTSTAEQDQGQGYAYMVSEIFVASRSNPEIKAALAALYAEARSAFADILRAKEREGVLRLRFDAESVLTHLFSAGDGAIIQRIVDPDRDFTAADAVGWEVARFLLGASRARGAAGRSGARAGGSRASRAGEGAAPRPPATAQRRASRRRASPSTSSRK